MNAKAAKKKSDPVLYATALKFLLSLVFLAAFSVGYFLVMNQQLRQAEQNAAVINFLNDQYNKI